MAESAIHIPWARSISSGSRTHLSRLFCLARIRIVPVPNVRSPNAEQQAFAAESSSTGWDMNRAEIRYYKKHRG